MQTLTLLRHAKSGYVDGLTDFKRHLTERGRRDAQNMAENLRERDCIPTSLLVSSAVRTRETARIVCVILDLPETSITYLSDLYLASPDVLSREINRAADTPHLMLIGHNPGLELLSLILDSRSPERMSTCSLNHFEIVSTPTNDSGNLDTQPSAGTLSDGAISDADNLDKAASVGESETATKIKIVGEWSAQLLFHEKPSR